MSALVLGEVLVVFVHTLIADDKYPVEDCENCHSQFKCNYLKNEILFLNSFFHFWNLHQILNVLKKKIIVIGNVFAKLETVKNFVRPLSKKRRFRTSFDSQHVKVSLIFATSA